MKWLFVRVNVNFHGDVPCCSIPMQPEQHDGEIQLCKSHLYPRRIYSPLLSLRKPIDSIPGVSTTGAVVPSHEFPCSIKVVLVNVRRRDEPHKKKCICSNKWGIILYSISVFTTMPIYTQSIINISNNW